MKCFSLCALRKWVRLLADIDFDMKGFDELENSLKGAIKKYPDMAEDRLEDISRKFKNRVIKITHQAVETHSGRLVKGFKLGKIRGYGINMEKDFRGTAPHFHLIENGHRLTDKDGKSIGKGWVKGYQIVKQARDEYAEKMPEEMQGLIDDIVKECGLD
jgi:hypothetical protein